MVTDRDIVTEVIDVCPCRYEKAACACKLKGANRTVKVQIVFFQNLFKVCV